MSLMLSGFTIPLLLPLDHHVDSPMRSGRRSGGSFPDPDADRLQRGVHSAAADAEADAQYRGTRLARSASATRNGSAWHGGDSFAPAPAWPRHCFALNDVFGDCFEVSAAEADDPKAFEEKWPKEQFIFDMQTHHVDVGKKWYDDRGRQANARLLPPAARAARLPKIAWISSTAAHYVKEVVRR